MYKIIKFMQIDSTNDYLKENYQKYLNKTVITTDYQTKGRGRMNRSWIDSKGRNLIFSILLFPKVNHINIAKISLLTCAAIFDVLVNKVENLTIKWPNDLLINNKKICGILSEAIFEADILKCLIVGVGINVNMTNLTPELKNKATSLSLETNQYYQRDLLLDEILTSFEHYYDLFLQNKHPYLKVCQEHFTLTGKKVQISSNYDFKEITIIKILDNGNLLIDDSGELKEVQSGEIRLI